MPLSPADRAQLTRRYQLLLAGISAQAIPRVDAAWDALPGFRDDDLPQFVESTTPATAAVRTAARALATGYVALILGKSPPAITDRDVPVEFNALGPFLAVRRSISEGSTFTEARLVGRAQAQASVRNLAISTARTTGDVVAAKTGTVISRWERNAEQGACAWCQRLDGTTYDSSSAADFGHDRCLCTASPVAS